MSLLELVSHPQGPRLAAALLHFIWQGAAIAAVVLLVSKWLPHRRPQVRYAVSLAALVLMAACPVGTFILGDSPPMSAQTASRSSETSLPATEPLSLGERGRGEGQSQTSPASDRKLTPGNAADEIQTQAATVIPVASGESAAFDRRADRRAWLSRALSVIEPYVVPAWLAGVLVLSVRLLFGFVALARLRRTRRTVPQALTETVVRLCNRIGFRKPPLVASSAEVHEAMAVGLLRPMVLLPVSWLTSMPPAVVEAVIAHELAHIRRWDLWVNLFQRVVETLLFYHPAVWWLSDRLRYERELCSDELAVRAVGRRVEYAEALEFVARKQWLERQPLLAAGIGGRNMALLNRIRHVLGTAQQKRQTGWWSAGLIALAVPVVWWIAASATVSATAGEEDAVLAFADEERGEGDRERERDPGAREGDRERGDRPAPREREREGDRPEGDRPEGERREGGERDRERPTGDRPRPERPEGDRPRPERRDPPPREGRSPEAEERPEGDRPEGRRPPGPPWRGEREELIQMIRQLREEVEQLRHDVRALREHAAGLAEAEYEKALEANRRVPGTIPDAEIQRRKVAAERAHRDGERPDVRRPERREGDRPAAERRDGDRPEAERREGERRDGERRDVERPDGERREGERREGDDD